MKKITTLLITLLACVLLNAEASDRYLFRMLDTGSGLPDNNVRNMTMLPNGLMCIQTSSMLNLYDGASCMSYKYNMAKIPYTEYSGMNRSYYDSTDNLIWCVTRDHIWVFNLTSRKFEYDLSARWEEMGIRDISPKGLHIDSKSRFWINKGDGNLLLCDKSQKSLKTIPLPQQMSPDITFADHNERTWVLSMNGVLAEYDPAMESFRMIRKIPQRSTKVTPSRIDMDITSKGKVWLMSDKEILMYDPEKDSFKSVHSLSPDSRDLFTTIKADTDDRIWLGSARSGVSIIESDGRMHTLPYLEMTDGKKIYHHTDISDIYIDRMGGVWIATLAEGLLYWHKDILRMTTIDNTYLLEGDMNDESVKCMVEEEDGRILVGTIHGLLRYDPQTRSMSTPYQMLKDELCIGLYRDNTGNIWLGTFYNGAYCIDRQGNIRRYRYQDMSVDISYHEARPNFNCVRSFLEDSQGRFWISVYGGMGSFNPHTGEITLLRDRHPELKRFMIIRDICQRSDGLLLASGDNGRFLYDPKTDTVFTDPESENCHTQTCQAITDRNGLLWMATADGVKVTDPKNGETRLIGTAQGIPAGNVMSLTQDDIGDIWAASFSYISRIKHSQGHDGNLQFTVSTFGKEDGVASGAFFHKSVLKHSSGRIYFGGAHGICEIRPERLYQSQTSEKPLLTSLHISGKLIEVGENLNGRILLDRELDKASGLELRHDETSITLGFSNLNYANPSHTTYLYKLENFDKKWHRISSQNAGKAQYTYLEPGNYTFKVMAANNEGSWNSPATIDITVRPPFYKSNLAYVIYFLIGIAFMGLIILFVIRQSQKKIQEEREREERQRKEDLDQMKFRFFTNISHELRTPLSLIMLPLESIMKEQKDSHLMSKLQTMHHNAEQLLSLVNHLLDFRRLEMGGEKLHLAKGNICEFVHSIAHSFRDAAQKNSISISFEDDMENPMMIFDSDQMQKIVNNLLSNALKFTPDGGFISVNISQGDNRMMVLKVSDTGIGIPEKDIPGIFDRFYRSDNTELRTGSGIGLSLVKQYVEMQGGSISVSSEVGKGTTFTVLIPTDLKAETAPDDYQEVETTVRPSVAEPASTARKHIMIVDDNVDFREYLVGEMSETYEVSSAEDGRQCIEMLGTANPDVIICDVMMPNMNGFEVVKAIKSNIETSHIPVILLSARTSDDIRLEGYETGADAYLTKPFKLDILHARIRNLIEERNRRIASFTKESDISPSDVTITTIDQKLMTRIMESIEKNMDNSEYSVEELSADVGMHRMNLYRKLQSLAGMTPSEFIRTMRLKRAAQLLRNDPNLTIVEVSDMVGFNTQKYFTKHFKEMFGVTPSQFRDEN